MEYIHISALTNTMYLTSALVLQTKNYIECNLFIGGAYSLEDGLAPSGGEGWAPPRARAYDDVYYNLSNTMFYADRLHKLVSAMRWLCFFRQHNLL